MAADRSPSTPAVVPNLIPGREVIVVEDELRVRTMLSEALKEMGFRATLTASAEAGARAMAQQRFDILILDLNLPGKGGIAFLESVRRLGNDLQVIILTGFGDLEAARAAIHLDVVEFLTKPCALGSLEVALDRARRRGRGQVVADRAAAEERVLSFESTPAPKAGSGEPTVPPPAAAGGGALEEIEQRHILGVLHKHGGNRSAAAAELGISIRKLYYRLGEYQRQGLVP
ncbi:MAG: multi-sensor signal transduction histidine kinase [Phycisphaerales bacterium]|nr:multi-sensor signal transduction histidine kinase [Phycisphaerales bacterium]